MLTETITDDICWRAKRADSAEEVAEVLRDVLLAGQIDRSGYTLDEIKTLLVHAMRACRAKRNEFPT